MNQRVPDPSFNVAGLLEARSSGKVEAPSAAASPSTTAAWRPGHMPHWPKILDVLIDELIQAAGEAEAQPFLLHVGQRLADELPLGRPQTLTALESEIDQQLGELGWGGCSIRDAGRHLVIEHADHPLMGAGAESEVARLRLLGLSWVLGGLYKGWLDAQGGHAEIVCERCQSHRPLVFHYGNA